MAEELIQFGRRSGVHLRVVCYFMEKILYRIGAICVNFETLDLVLSSFISRLISDDSKVGAIITSEMSFSNLVHTFSSLVKHKFQENPELLSEINKLVVILGESEAIRNQIVHSNYFYRDFEKDRNDIGRLKVTSRRKKGLVINSNEVTEDSLKDINERIVFATKQLHSLYSHLFPGEQIKFA